MTDRYLLPKARNTITKQTVKTQDLTGARFTLAQQMTRRTGDAWVGFVEEYTPTYRRS